MFSVGSPVGDEPPSLARRSSPTCCQQKLLTLALADGLKPAHGAFGAACLTPLETKIWSWLPEPLTLPSCSSHATHGTGSAPRHGGPAGDRRVLGLLVGVDVQRRDARSTVLPLGLPHVVGGHEAAGEDLLLATERRVGLVPRVPRDGAPSTGEVDRRRFRLDVLVDVQRWALRDPLPVLERAHEDALGAAGLLLEGGPRHARASSDERSTDDVRDPGVLIGVDAGRRVVVDLRAVGGQADHCACRSCRHERGRHADERGTPEK
jgi:hypothetical protein